MQKDLLSHRFVLKLKRNQTPSELKFYKLLKECIAENFPELVGYVGKQVPISHPRGFYILDFYIGRIKIAFEIDGGYHWSDKQLGKDLKRDSFFEYKKNIKMHHIPNNDLKRGKRKKELKEKLIFWIKKRQITAKKVAIKKEAIKHGWRKNVEN